MSDCQINATVSENCEINTEIGGCSSTKNWVNAGTPFYLNGQNGDTYFVYNSTTNMLELWVNGSKVLQWD